MSRTVTSEVLIAYSLCPQKAFLLLCTEEKRTLHKYEPILQHQQPATHNHSHTALLQTNLDIRSYAPAALTSACDVLVNATLLTEGLEAVCSMLTKVVQPSSLGGYSYEPAIIRLAKAYCISPKILVIQEILIFLGIYNRDRKSTRLNSSHQIISYAVFCLKKKKPITNSTHTSAIP